MRAVATGMEAISDGADAVAVATAATGVGVAGATTAYASNRAAKSGIFAKVGAAGSKATQMTQETINKLKLAKLYLDTNLY